MKISSASARDCAKACCLASTVLKVEVGVGGEKVAPPGASNFFCKSSVRFLKSKGSSSVCVSTDSLFS